MNGEHRAALKAAIDQRRRELELTRMPDGTWRRCLRGDRHEVLLPREFGYATGAHPWSRDGGRRKYNDHDIAP